MFWIAQRGDGVQRLNLTCQPWTITHIGHSEVLIPGNRVQTHPFSCTGRTGNLALTRGLKGALFCFMNTWELKENPAVIGSRMIHQLTIQLTNEAMFSVSGYAETRTITTEPWRQYKIFQDVCVAVTFRTYIWFEFWGFQGGPDEDSVRLGHNVASLVIDFRRFEAKYCFSLDVSEDIDSQEKPCCIEWIAYLFSCLVTCIKSELFKFRSVFWITKLRFFGSLILFRHFHGLLIYVGQNTFVYKTGVNFPISFDSFSWNKVLYVYNQAQNVVSFDTDFTIYLRFHTTLGCGDAAFSKFFVEKLPVKHFVLNAWAPLKELKSSSTIFTRVLLCTVSWVNVHIPHFSRTENYYRVCAEGMSLFSIKKKGLTSDILPFVISDL